MAQLSQTMNFLDTLNIFCSSRQNDHFLTDDSESDPDWSLRQEVESKCDSEILSNISNSPNEKINYNSDKIDELPYKYDNKVPKYDRGSSSFICMVCLIEEENGSYASNQLVCRKCGITVHTECYDHTDLESTDPECHWICDPCSCGAKYIHCELCPSKDRIPMKQTQNGLWVHLICAQYTKVIYPDCEVLSLDHLKGSMWGTRACSLCPGEDRWVGVSCRCDAGLCKKYCHASCAQKAGLLSIAQDMQPLTQHIEKEQESPFYFFCTLHRIKEHTGLRRRAWEKAYMRAQRSDYTFTYHEDSTIEERDSLEYSSNPTPFVKTERFLQFSPTFIMALKRKNPIFQST